MKGGMSLSPTEGVDVDPGTTIIFKLAFQKFGSYHINWSMISSINGSTPFLGRK